MKLFKNRILPLILALLLTMSVGIPAFAEDPEEEDDAANTETEITGTYTAPKIAVTVPETGDAFINPLGLPVEVGNGEKVVGQQIVTAPLFISNEGDIAMKVSASVTGVLPEGSVMKFLAADTTIKDGTEGNKAAFLYFQMAPTSLTGTTGPYDAQGKPTADASEEIANWDQAYSATKDVVIQNGKPAKSTAPMVILSASTITPGSQPQDPATITYNAGSIAMFRLAGVLVEEPKTPWDTNDTFSATVAFTFKPDTTTATITSQATGGSTTIDNTAGGATLDLKVALSDESLTITSVTWASGTEATATVAKKGTPTNGSEATVTAVANGTSTITATVVASNGATYTGTIDIEVENT